MNSANIRTKRVQYPNQTFDEVVLAPTNQQLLIHSAGAHNGLNAVNDVGIGYSLNATDYSTARVGNTLVVSSKYNFDLVALNLSTADTSGTVFTVEYWNGAWTALPLISSAPNLLATGQQAILFAPPQDWIKDANALYSIRLNSTLTPNYVASAIKTGQMLAFRERVLPYATVQVKFETRQLLLQQGSSIIAFFSYPSPYNRVEASYQINP